MIASRDRVAPDKAGFLPGLPSKIIAGTISQEVAMSEPQLERGVPATEELLKKIPERDLKLVIGAYRTIEKYTTKKNIEGLRKGISGIRDCLTMLKGNGYISETAAKNVLDTLIDGLAIYDNDDLIHILMALVFNQAKRPKDWAFDVFIWFMLEKMAEKKQTPDFDLIADFLNEQGLKEGLTRRALESRSERFDIELMREFKDFFIETSKLRSMPKWERRDTVKAFLKANLLP